jgi:hypothetical protein
MRKIFSISSALLMLGVSGLVAQTFTVTSFPHRGPSMAQSSTYLGVAIASVSVAVEETTKPCLTGVSTCAPNVNGGLSIAFPRYFLQSGQSNVVTVVVEDTSYAGPCTVDFVIKNSSSTLAWGYGPASCQPNVDTLFVFPVQLPDPGFPSWAPVSVNVGLILSNDSNGAIVNGATLPAVLGQGGAIPYPTIVGPSSISIGAQTTGLPCSNCGPATLGPNVSIPVPMYVVPRNQPLTVTLVSENINYTGPCTLKYAIKQGAAAISGGTRATSAGCSAPPGSGYVTAWGVNLPMSVEPGPAILEGAIMVGSNTYGLFQQISIE